MCKACKGKGIIRIKRSGVTTDIYCKCETGREKERMATSTTQARQIDLGGKEITEEKIDGAFNKLDKVLDFFGFPDEDGGPSFFEDD